MAGHTVIVQKWEESERGWGTRPDGYSLHLTDADRLEFINEYWEGMPSEIPDEYSRPSGTPYTATVTDEVYNEIKESGNGIHESGTPPGTGGVDGWVPLR